MEIRERRWWDACQAGRDTGRVATEPPRSRAGLAPILKVKGPAGAVTVPGEGLKKARRRWERG